jgi:hypothetical protein
MRGKSMSDQRLDTEVNRLFIEAGKSQTAQTIKKESRTLLRLPMRTEHTLNLLRHQRGAADIRLTTHMENCISASTTRPI